MAHLFTLSLGIAAVARAADRAPKAPLTLTAAVDIALRNNFGLAVRRFEAFSAREDVEVARAIFEPELFGTAGRNFRAGDAAASDLEVTGYRGGVTTKLPSGATFELSSDVTRTEFGFAPDSYLSESVVSLRQPLLKGGGFYINRLPITFAQIDVSQANFETRRTVLELLRNVESAWWDLVFAHRDKDLAMKTLDSSERLLEEARARVKVGLATDLDILQANTAIAARREALITAKQVIDDRLDGLLLFMGKLGEQEYKVVLPARLPHIQGRTIGTQEALQLVRALPEYQVQLAAIHQQMLLVDRARNDRLPVVDLTGTGGYNGLGRNTGDAFDRGFHKHEDWSVLLEMRIPLGFRAERAQLRKAGNALDIERLRQAELEQLLHSQIREAARAVDAGLEKIAVTDAFVRLSDQQYDQLVAKFKEGLTTFRETQLAQDDIQEARSRALAAQLEAVKASIRLARYDGTLLSRYGLAWGSEK
ncbi:MAG: outer membrane protein [Chthoniobacter sp.]|nr:outer membrane protein [Chthoniobacter sp.]